ncbi:hypothetical protein SOVF_160210, partial [Spinacia oleracea]
FLLLVLRYRNHSQ